jgi:hypothetical protein
VTGLSEVAVEYATAELLDNNPKVAMMIERKAIVKNQDSWL